MQNEDTTTTLEERKIILHFTSMKSVLVYDPQDCYDLYTKFKLLNRSIGSLPNFITQNIFHSLPMSIPIEFAKWASLHSTHISIHNSSQHASEWNSFLQYPNNSKQEQIRYAVFTDLYQKGYYISSGDRFGVDFIIYHDDPLLYHACGMVYICNTEYQNRKIDSKLLCSLGRLATTVNKTFQLAYWNDTTQSVQYVSWKFYQPFHKTILN